MEDMRMIRLEIPHQIDTFPKFQLDGRTNGGLKYIMVPSDILVYDFVLSFSKTHSNFITYVYELYRHVSNGYKKAELDERLISGNPDMIETFLVVNHGPKNKTSTEIKGFITTVSGEPRLNKAGEEWLLGPRPDISRSVRYDRSPTPIEKAKRNAVKEPSIPELLLPEPSRVTLQQRVRARREEAANTALQLSLEAQANDEKVRSSPKSRSPKGTARKSFFGGKKKKYTCKV
jgi:hypothetical protein